MAYTIKFLRTLEDKDSCADGIKCPAIAEVDGMEDLYVIVTDETDPAILAAFADRVGPGERLGRVPRSLLPEMGRE
jgi:hypothetical protein